MTGFKRKALKLTWPEGHDLHGLEVLCRRPTIGQVERVQGGRTGDDEDDVAAVNRLIAETIGAALISWNYRDESDEPVPATVDGILSVDLDAQLEILSMWASSAIGVPKDLGKVSDSGRPSPAGTSVMPVTGTPGLSDALENLHALNASSPSSNASPATP